VSTVNRDEHGGRDVAGTPDDTALLRMITGGDQAAFATLYDRYSLLAYHLAYQLIGNREGAEAVVLDVFLHLWRRRRGPDPAKFGVRAWLLTSIYHAGRGGDISQPRLPIPRAANVVRTIH
jgi:hypothetical protein